MSANLILLRAIPSVFWREKATGLCRLIFAVRNLINPMGNRRNTVALCSCVGETSAQMCFFFQYIRHHSRGTATERADWDTSPARFHSNLKQFHQKRKLYLQNRLFYLPLSIFTFIRKALFKHWYFCRRIWFPLLFVFLRSAAELSLVNYSSPAKPALRRRIFSWEDLIRFSLDLA